MSSKLYIHVSTCRKSLLEYHVLWAYVYINLTRAKQVNIHGSPPWALLGYIIYGPKACTLDYNDLISCWWTNGKGIPPNEDKCELAPTTGRMCAYSVAMVRSQLLMVWPQKEAIKLIRKWNRTRRRQCNINLNIQFFFNNLFLFFLCHALL